MVFLKGFYSGRTVRRLFIYSLVILSIFITALFVTRVSNSQLQLSNSVSVIKSVNERNLVESILKCSGVEQIDPNNLGCVEKLAIEAMESGLSAKELMDIFASLYKSDGKKPALNCHLTFHTVGKLVNILDLDLNAYKEYLSYCGNGFLHGMIESLQIDDDPILASSELKPLCNKLVKIGIITMGDIATQCWHPLGHGLWYHFGDASRALVVCSTAAPVGVDRFWCAQAVLMSSDVIKEIESVQKFSLSIDHCKALALDDTDIYDGCVVTYARNLLQSTSKLRGEFVAFCSTINPRVALGCKNTAAETIASKALVSDAQGVIEEVMLTCFLSNSEEWCVAYAVHIASGAMGLTESLVQDLFDPAIEKFVSPEKRTFVRELIAHPERIGMFA